MTWPRCRLVAFRFPVSDAMARYFTLDEARQLLPTIEEDLRLALRVKEELGQVAGELQQYSQHVAMMGGVLVDRKKMAGQRSRAEALAHRLKETLEGIQERGCLVKDLDVGLLDFPTRYRGQEVYLCWRLGESDIAFWHGVEEGFRGRKPIDDGFVADHRGGDG